MDHTYQRVRFILGLVVGDNLALNSVLGFTSSFSSNHFCRICKASKADTQKLSTEREEFIRTAENSKTDLERLCTGTVSESPSNGIPSFDVTY